VSLDFFFDEHTEEILDTPDFKKKGGNKKKKQRHILSSSSFIFGLEKNI